MREMLRVALQQVSPTRGHDAIASSSVDHQVAAPSAAAHQPRLVSQGESPFLDRGVGNQGARICRAYNRGRCAYNPCRFRHLCKLCGGSHPATKCPKSQARKSTIPQRIIRKP
ncbi:hypothetical protein LSAT2_001283 [Lamellibrachia satsuma]|nr:hypothetical protein LSAT2_001283 [Lamellibrachia satsuma]